MTIKSRAILLMVMTSALLAVSCGKNFGLGGSGLVDLSGVSKSTTTNSSSALGPIIASSGDYDSTCAVSTSAGNVYCWGVNDQGQLGDNTLITRETPVEVLGVGGVGNLSGIVSITVGDAHACAVTSAGAVYCWGSDLSGQLGDNNPGVEENTPVQVLGVGAVGTLSGITQVSALDSSTCALSSQGNVYCWGNNSSGLLGNNSVLEEDTPVEVLGVGAVGVLSGITGLGMIGGHSCALSSSGNVYCWGQNTDGQLGNNTTIDAHTPVEVVGVGAVGFLSGIINISGAGSASCGVSSAGNVYCWGNNSDGQLGNNSTVQSPSPVEVKGVGGVGFLSGIIQVSGAEDDHTCALTSGGNVYCWGFNGQGQLGVNTAITSHTPVEVLGVGAVGNLSSQVDFMAGDGRTSLFLPVEMYFAGGIIFPEISESTRPLSKKHLLKFWVSALWGIFRGFDWPKQNHKYIRYQENIESRISPVLNIRSC